MKWLGVYCLIAEIFVDSFKLRWGNSKAKQFPKNSLFFNNIIYTNSVVCMYIFHWLDCCRNVQKLMEFPSNAQCRLFAVVGGVTLLLTQVLFFFCFSGRDMTWWFMFSIQLQITLHWKKKSSSLHPYWGLQWWLQSLSTIWQIKKSLF